VEQQEVDFRGLRKGNMYRHEQDVPMDRRRHHGASKIQPLASELYSIDDGVQRIPPGVTDFNARHELAKLLIECQQLTTARDSFNQRVKEKTIRIKFQLRSAAMRERNFRFSVWTIE